VRFILSDTKQRYRSTLSAMESSRMTSVGLEWENAGLGFFFGSDLNRAHLSVIDTLAPMLLEDDREEDADAMRELLATVTLEQTAGDTAARIHQAYLTSRPKG
jgi:hypothetical protein